jgi:hypothetical protein
MKKFSILLATAALPFLLVWAAFFLTGFSFTPKDVFQDGTFWGLSMMYWFLWICMVGPIVELIDVSVNNKN